MKIAIAIIAALGGASMFWGRKSEQSAKSADEALGSLIPYGIGAVLLIGDVLLALGYAVFR